MKNKKIIILRTVFFSTIHLLLVGLMIIIDLGCKSCHGSSVDPSNKVLFFYSFKIILTTPGNLFYIDLIKNMFSYELLNNIIVLLNSLIWGFAVALIYTKIKGQEK